MPVYEPERKGWGWPAYLAIGCGGCVVLVILVLVGSTVLGIFVARRAMNQAMNPVPITRTKPYDWGYWSQAPNVVVALPDGSRLTYAHGLIHTSAMQQPVDGQRGIKIAAGGRSQEWPLLYSPVAAVKVGVYWHPSRGGQGPVIRFLDATGESALDLQRREAGDIGRSGGRAYLAYYAYDDTTFCGSSSESTTTNGKATTKYFSADLTPARDVTAVLTSQNCRYLGSIVRKGNKLIFVPAPSRAH